MIWQGRYIDLYGPGSYSWRACANCRRPLTDPLSMERGIGPDCWQQLAPDEREAVIAAALESDRTRWRIARREERERAEEAERQRTKDVLARETRVTWEGMRYDRETGELLGPVLGWGRFSKDQRRALVEHGHLP